jgi:hypothetical protein
MRALFLILALLFVSTAATAQKQYSFTPIGSVTLLTGNGWPRTQVISIKNDGNSSLTLSVTFQGDSTFQYRPAAAQVFTLGADSSRIFNVVYQASEDDTSHCFMRISDSAHVADTVRFTGIDTGDVFMPWEFGEFDYLAGSFYSKDDTVWVPIHNNMNDSCFVTSTIVTSESYGFTAIGSQQRSIPANGTTNFGFIYNSSNYEQAYALVRFQGEGLSNTVGMQGKRAVQHRDSLVFSGDFDFGSLPPGDTVCRTFTVHNYSDTAGVLTSIGTLANSGYYILDEPTGPVTIEAHDSLHVTICFVAPMEAGVSSYVYILVAYAFGNWQGATGARLYGSSQSCFRASTDIIYFGPVIRDQSETKTFYIVNVHNETTVIDLSLNPNGSAFNILTSSPVTIAAYDTAAIEVRFTADGNGSQSAKLVMDGRDSCGQLEVALIGTIDSVNTVDSSAFALYANEEHTLNFVGDSSNSTKHYTFYNNQHDPVKVLSVGLKQGIHFTITDIDPSNPEFTLDSGEVMGVTVEFDETPGTYTDTLVIATEDGFIAINFPMHAVINGTADVATPAFGAPHMTVTPNPSSGPVTISITDANTASIEVLDIMGKRIARFDGGSAMLARNDLSAGTYFVRASGVGVDRKPFVMTTRIVVK